MGVKGYLRNRPRGTGERIEGGVWRGRYKYCGGCPETILQPYRRQDQRQRIAVMVNRVFAVLCASLVLGIEARVPEKNAILDQIRKNGACVSAIIALLGISIFARELFSFYNTQTDILAVHSTKLLPAQQSPQRSGHRP